MRENEFSRDASGGKKLSSVAMDVSKAKEILKSTKKIEFPFGGKLGHQEVRSAKEKFFNVELNVRD